MRRVLSTLLLVPLLVLIPAADSPDPVTCAGYPEPRTFLETQDWWTPIPELGGTGHIHLGMCFPTGTVNGKVTFDVRVLLHDNKGTLDRVKMQDDTSKDWVIIKPNITPPDGGQHTYWFQITVDTALMKDGIRLFRWYAFLTHSNGNKQTARSGWPLDVENGKADSNGATAGQYKFQNWYQRANPPLDYGYTGPIITPKGNGVFGIKCTTGANVAIDRTFVHADPDFHAGNEGTVVLNVAGAYNGNVTAPAGAKRLVVRCQQVNGSETHEGVGSVSVSP